MAQSILPSQLCLFKQKLNWSRNSIWCFLLLITLSNYAVADIVRMAFSLPFFHLLNKNK